MRGPNGTVLRRAGFGLLAVLATAGAIHAASEPQPVVLFDEAHGQRFRIGSDGPLDLSRFAAIVTRRGGLGRTGTKPLSKESLAGAQALVVSGALQPLAPSEVEAVVSFVEAGGRLAVMLHVEPPQAKLLHRLGVSTSNVPIREQKDVLGGEALNFRVRRVAPHTVTEGISSFFVFGAWALLPVGSGVRAIAETSPQAWADLNHSAALEKTDAMQAFAVAVAADRGKGSFVAFGDDALFQNQHLQAENGKLAENLVAWLLSVRPRKAVAPLLQRSHE